MQQRSHSTVVKADASRESFRTLLVPVQDYIRRVKEHEAQDYACTGTVNPEKMGGRRKRIGKAQTIQSKTDPEAEFLSRPGKGTRVSIDDMRGVPSLMTTSTFLAGRKPECVVADSHYGGIKALKYCQDQAIETCIHPRLSDANKGRFRNIQFARLCNGVIWNAPMEKRHRRRSSTDSGFSIDLMLQYISHVAWGSSVPIEMAVEPWATIQGRDFNNALNLVESLEGRRLLWKRQTTIEGVLAEAKNHHSLSRCRCRGLSFFNIQLYLTATVVTIKRLLVERNGKAKGGALMNASHTQRRTIFCLAMAQILR